MLRSQNLDLQVFLFPSSPLKTLPQKHQVFPIIPQSTPPGRCSCNLCGKKVLITLKPVVMEIGLSTWKPSHIPLSTHITLKQYIGIVCVCDCICVKEASRRISSLNHTFSHFFTGGEHLWSKKNLDWVETEKKENRVQSLISKCEWHASAERPSEFF